MDGTALPKKTIMTSTLIHQICASRPDLTCREPEDIFAKLGIPFHAENQKIYDDYLHWLKQEPDTNKATYTQRIAMIQEWLVSENLTYFLLPRADRYNQEFLPACNERILWLTGFSGSSGFVCISANECVLFSDSRYTIQMQQQTPEHVICHDGSKSNIEDYLQDHVQSGERVGFPKWQLSIDMHEKISKIITKNNAILEGFIDNPIDIFWQNRPAEPLSLPHIMDEKYSGKTASKKIKQLRNQLHEHHANETFISANFISDLSMIAWLLNIRGSDIYYAPVNIAMLIITQQNANLFINQSKITPEIKQYLDTHFITCYPIKHLIGFMAQLKQETCLMDGKKTPFYIKELFENHELSFIIADQPMQKQRAIKNEEESNAIRDAHIADGVAMVKFLHWLEQQPTTDELTIAETLEKFRQQHSFYRGASFATIAAFAEHGAIVHYHSNTQTNYRANQQNGCLLLLDSGGHYINGTTDITRTIPYGKIDNALIMRDYTLVLKAHINLAMQHFPYGTNGGQLDAICRAPLWQYQCHYRHGTGHGVGMYLDVHEGPCHISPNMDMALEEGMIFSNEPGHYQENAYGIRIENLILTKSNGDINDTWLHFETITLCPINLDLIDKNLLNASEITWLNHYHQMVWQKLSPYFDDDNLRQWLKNATRNVG